jgi:hypothetical protein
MTSLPLVMVQMSPKMRDDTEQRPRSFSVPEARNKITSNT